MRLCKAMPAPKVTILLTEALSLFELASAVELFALPRPEFDTWYETEVVSLTKGTYDGLCNTQFTCNTVSSLPQTDLLVIPSFPANITRISEVLKSQIRQHYQGGGRIICFCSGVFLLAALGIMQGRIATTHWRYADLFKQRFPHVTYKEDILYHYDGVIGCSAGSAAGIDLGIEVIRQDFGYDIANKVARRLVLPAHRTGGQTQFVEKPIVKTQSSIAKTLDWATINLSAQLTINQMAQHANMTRRTFDRQFKKHYHITPQHWLIQQKIDLAKSLLESSNYTVEQVSEMAGFETAVTLRHNFRKFVSVSPTEYRNRFAQTSC